MRTQPRDPALSYFTCAPRLHPFESNENSIHIFAFSVWILGPHIEWRAMAPHEYYMFIASYRKSNDVEFLFLVLLLLNAAVPVVICYEYEAMTCFSCFDITVQIIFVFLSGREVYT